jgi:hypothetical protein
MLAAAYVLRADLPRAPLAAVPDFLAAPPPPLLKFVPLGLRPSLRFVPARAPLFRAAVFLIFVPSALPRLCGIDLQQRGAPPSASSRLSAWLCGPASHSLVRVLL